MVRRASKNERRMVTPSTENTLEAFATMSKQKLQDLSIAELRQLHELACELGGLCGDADIGQVKAEIARRLKELCGSEQK